MYEQRASMCEKCVHCKMCIICMQVSVLMLIVLGIKGTPNSVFSYTVGINCTYLYMHSLLRSNYGAFYGACAVVYM